MVDARTTVGYQGTGATDAFDLVVTLYVGLSSTQRKSRPLLIRQALFVNLARAEVSKPLDGLKLNGIGTLQ